MLPNEIDTMKYHATPNERNRMTDYLHDKGTDRLLADLGVDTSEALRTQTDWKRLATEHARERGRLANREPLNERRIVEAFGHARGSLMACDAGRERYGSLEKYALTLLWEHVQGEWHTLNAAKDEAMHTPNATWDPAKDHAINALEPIVGMLEGLLGRSR